MSALLRNIRFGLRTARLNPAFSLMIVATLAMGVGANTTIFGVVYGLVLNPFPFPEPDRVVGVGTAYPKLGADLSFWENLSPIEFEDVRDNSRTLEDVVAWDMGNRRISGEGPPQNVFTGFWWGDALRTLGMSAYLGRGFSDQELAEGAPVALLSYRLWHDRFGADSTLVGHAIQVDDDPYTVIGILPEGVDIYNMDLWTVMAAPPDRFARNRRQFQLMARVRQESTLQQVNAELEGLARRTEQAYEGDFPEYYGWRMQALTWNEVSSRTFRTGAFILLGAVGFVLLLVCANAAGLLLARAQYRRREMAVRTAMGAGRGRLLAQLLTESLVLATAGGAAGAGIAWLGVRGVRATLATLSFGLAGSVELSAPVLLFNVAVALAAGIVFGLVPAFQASSIRIAGTLQTEGKGATGGAGRQRLQRALVAIEVALAFVLLVGGGLLVNSFVRLSRVDPGFAADDLLTMRLTLSAQRYRGLEIPAFFSRLTERLEAVPGVRSAAATSQYPPRGFSFMELFFEGSPPRDGGALPRALATLVTPGYFETMGIPLRAGRLFDARDRAGGPLVAILNEAAARRYYPGGDAVGRRFKRGAADSPNSWFEIVGVVGSTQNRGLDQPPQPEVYVVDEQAGQGANQLFLMLRTDVEPHSVLPAVRTAIAEIDPDQPVYAIQTVAEAFATAASGRRATTFFVSIFGLFALALAAVGVYSVVSYTVSQRTQEIGLRVALGASPGGVRRLVVGQALLPVLLGAAVGGGLALPVGRALRDLLFQVSAIDPLTLAAVATLLVGVATLASFVPAWRASRLHPTEALRVD